MVEEVGLEPDLKAGHEFGNSRQRNIEYLITIHSVMFNFFKRSKRQLSSLEEKHLLELLGSLPSEYSILKQQVEEGLIRAALRTKFKTHFMINIGFESDIYEKYRSKTASRYIISNILLYTDDEREITLWLYVTDEVLSNIESSIDFQKIDSIQRIDTSRVKKVFPEGNLTARIKSVLTPEEIQIIGAVNLFEITLDGKVYIHIRDLEDGDFLGIDLDRACYCFTHDPYGIKKIKDRFDVSALEEDTRFYLG